MAHIRYKKFKNNTYAYEVTATWDAKLKQSRSKSKYLGKVDEITKEIIKIEKKQKGQEKCILDFGDGYFLNEFIKNSTIYPVYKSHLFDVQAALIPLIIYRLCTGSAMYNCKDWLDGNILGSLFNNVDLSSQRISELLTFLGNEQVQRSFFLDYIKLVGGSKKSVIIDATTLPNNIHIDFNAWGRADGGIDKQFKLLCVVDQISKLPLFYRFLPGNISDVSTLETTIHELERMGVQNSFALLDAGYFSEKNIKDLYSRKIDFLTRLPANRTIYRDIILKKTNDLESLKYTQISGNRTVFVKKIKIDLFESKTHAYIILDLNRKAKDMAAVMAKYHQNPSEEDEHKLAFASCGIFVLVSSKAIEISEVLSSYHTRQSVEQIFSFSKSDLNLLPIRHHNDNTVRGYLFLQFLLLVLFIQIREKIYKDYTVEQALMILRKLKCKVFDNQVIPQEASRAQKDIFEKYNILVPKSLGI